jgi:hypothetical protein
LRQLDRTLPYTTKDGPRKTPAADVIALILVVAAARGSSPSLKAVIDILRGNPDTFVDPEISNQAETAEAASEFDRRFTRVLDTLEREAIADVERESEELKKPPPDETDAKKDGNGEE